ncbi:MAG: DtxR family transcriptional regulator [Deltaproteobacteria bacterium]|nr:DtxR family transcriptional regulator [Deltaproteobacteria bacterium]
MPREASLSASMEDYLEAIANIQQNKRVVRVRDIAKYLKVKMPSVSGALKGLVKKNLVSHESYEYVELTGQGQQLAEEVAHKHEVLRRFLSEILGLDTKTAETDACQMEHAVGDKTLERLVKFIEFVDACPKDGPGCLKQFRRAVETGDFNIVCPFEGDAEIHSDDDAQTVKLEEDKKIVNEQPLNQLKPGMKGTITKVLGRGHIHRRILDMGVGRGAIVEVDKIAPLGDPIDIKVRGYHLSLRKEEAANIFVEVID